jgi:hypothetical protein
MSACSSERQGDIEPIGRRKGNLNEAEVDVRKTRIAQPFQHVPLSCYMSPEVKPLVDRLNEYAVEGIRELYEVVE